MIIATGTTRPKKIGARELMKLAIGLEAIGAELQQTDVGAWLREAETLSFVAYATVDGMRVKILVSPDPDRWPDE